MNMEMWPEFWQGFFMGVVASVVVAILCVRFYIAGRKAERAR